jgi:hypothetical protein
MRLLETITPKAVEGLKVMNELTTFRGASITFSLPKELVRVSAEIMFDVWLLPNDGSSWKKILLPRIQVEEGWGFLQLDNLEYANTEYKVKLRIKSKISMDKEEFWSPFNEVEFKTKPTFPALVPETCVNCFNVMDNGNVMVYWTSIKKLYQNADNFFYYIRGYNEENVEIVSQKSQDAFIVLAKELKAETLVLKIFTSNSEGISTSFSEIVIPFNETENKKKMLNIRKEFDGKSYRISWSTLPSIDIKSFTIVWCNQRNELLNQCDGPISFSHTESNSKTFEAYEAKQFGVAPNFKNSSIINGFEWAECTASKPEGELFHQIFIISQPNSILFISSEIGQVHSFWSSVHSNHSVTLHWKVNCVDEAIIMGYQIDYCQLNDSDSSECIDRPAPIYLTPEEDKIDQFQVDSLKVFKSYNFSISLMAVHHIGPSKGPITAKTLEAG